MAGFRPVLTNQSLLEAAVQGSRNSRERRLKRARSVNDRKMPPEISRCVQVGVGVNSLRNQSGGGLNIGGRGSFPFERFFRPRSAIRVIRKPGDPDAHKGNLARVYAHARR